MQMMLKIELLSDFCPASGNGYAGSIDTDINYDQKTGLPYLPAKRIKGCLREAALDVLSFFHSKPDEYKEYAALVDTLFGKSGQSIGGSLKISDGQLSHSVCNVNRFDVLDALTSLRYSTQMENSSEIIKKAKEKTFRTVRVINKGAAFFCNVKILAETEENALKIRTFLILCCGMLKNMGLNRTRGWGEVLCTISEIEKNNAPKVTHTAFELPTYAAGNSRAISYKITLKEPVISAPLSGEEGCEGYLPGSMLLGYFANRWIKAKSKDEESNKPPHKNIEFRRMFLEGGIKFGSAYPGKDKPYYPAPVTIKTNKSNDEAYDDCVDKPDHNLLRKLSRKLGGFLNVASEEGKSVPSVANIQYDVQLHHARPSDRGVGHAQKSNEAGNNGGLFSYKALSANQTFFGSIVGEESDLQKLLSLAEPFIQLGRSRSAQYGNVTFEWLSDHRFLSGNKILIHPAEKVRVLVKSPLILCDASGTIVPDAGILAKHLGLDIEKSFVSESFVAGYNATWRLPRGQMRSIKPGSVITMVNNGGDECELDAEQFIGLRTGEGFGHIGVEKLPKEGYLSKPKFVDILTSSPPQACGVLFDTLPVKSLSDIIANNKRNLEQENAGWAYGIKFFKVNEESGTPTNSQLSRLMMSINRVSKQMDPFAELKKELRDNDPIWKLEKNRKKIKLFSCIDNPPTANWDDYKRWLLAAISGVKHERRARDAK